MRSTLHAFLVTLIAWALLSGAMNAQDARAHVQGLVTDSSNAVIVGASVTLFNTKTGVKMVRPTNETGLYRFDYVDPGTYTITVEAAGFSRFSQESFDVRAQGDVTVNAALKLGGVTETVTVGGAIVELQFNTSNHSLTIDTKMANEVPRFDRNPFKLTLLMPSALNQPAAKSALTNEAVVFKRASNSIEPEAHHRGMFYTPSIQSNSVCNSSSMVRRRWGWAP